MSVRMYDSTWGRAASKRAQLTFDTDVGASEGSKTLSNRVFGINACVLEFGEESFAASLHTLHDRGVNGEVEVPFVGFSEAY